MSKKLAIKGHATRGKEVIEILEMMGGRNPYAISADAEDLSFTIRDDDNYIIACYPTGKFVFFTLEEFLEKFPYKVGDKVLYKTYGIYSTIKTMKWNAEKEQVFYRLYSKNLFVATVGELNPCKEETMENKLEQIALDIPDGYEFFGINNDNKVVLTKIQPQYPKTYGECCRIVNANPHIRLKYDLSDGQKYSYDAENLHVYENLRKLLICRDAYWKIAGEQMDLGKPWKPDWLNTKQDKFVLYTHNNVICLNCFMLGHNVLAFPTEEMRDAFYEIFKELIETCKELL